MRDQRVTARLEHSSLILILLAGATGVGAWLNSPTIVWSEEVVERSAAPAKDPYRIGSGDLLEIIPVKMVPKSPYLIEVGDELKLFVAGSLPDAHIDGLYPVHSDGTVNLGFGYSKVRVVGMTLEDVQIALRLHLVNFLRGPIVTASLGSLPDRRSVKGEHVVGSDGKIILGVFGAVDVTGKTLVEARSVVEKKLAKSYDSVELWVRLVQCNSRFCHVVLSKIGGTRVTRIKVDGNSRVLDAIASQNGFELIHEVHLARPGARSQVLEVDWKAILKGDLATNHRLRSGDVVRVKCGAP